MLLGCHDSWYVGNNNNTCIVECVFGRCTAEWRARRQKNKYESWYKQEIQEIWSEVLSIKVGRGLANGSASASLAVQPASRRHRSIKDSQAGKDAIFRSQTQKGSGGELVGRRIREATRGQGLGRADVMRHGFSTASAVDAGIGSGELGFVEAASVAPDTTELGRQNGRSAMGICPRLPVL